MEDDLHRKMMVDAIIGRGFSNPLFAEHYTREGLAEFCGNQWNPDWRWKRPELLKLPLKRLETIYLGYERIIEIDQHRVPRTLKESWTPLTPAAMDHAIFDALKKK